MSNSRISLSIVILITIVTALAGILGNIAVSALPPQWTPYLWLAWPLSLVMLIITIALGIIQHRLDRQSQATTNTQQHETTEKETPPPNIEAEYKEIQERTDSYERIYPLQPLKEPLPWNELRKITQLITRLNMAGSRVKYNPDLYLPRAELQATFEDFLASDKTGFILLGKSGAGKSNFLFSVSDDTLGLHPERCWLLFEGTHIDQFYKLEHTLTEDFSRHLPESLMIAVLKEIARIPDIAQHKVILCFDAINENSQPALLLHQIDTLVRTTPWPWLKIVITCRPEAWRLICSGISEGKYYQPSDRSVLGEEEPFHSAELRPFARDELAAVYEKYKKVYQLQAPYSDYLEHEATLAILQDPLILRMEARMNAKGSIPIDIKLRSVVPKFIEFLTDEPTGTVLLNEADLEFLQNDLMPLMVEQEPYHNKITAEQLQKADQSRKGRKRLSELVVRRHSGTQRFSNQSFTNLVDAQILTHYGKGKSFEISFTFEMYWDYFAGEYLLARFQKLPNTEEKAAFITRLVLITRNQPYLIGPVHNLLFRALDAEAGDVLLRIASSSNTDCQSLVASVLLEYFLDNPDLVRSLLGRWQMGWGRQRLTPGEENRALVAVEVAGGIANTEILLSAMRSRHEAVRDRAVIATYKLWCQERTVGRSVLENLVGQVGLRTLLLSPQMIQSSVALSVLIYFNHFDDPDGCGRVVLDVWRPRLKRFFLYNPRTMGESRFRQLFRNGVLTLLIKITLGLLKSIPSRYSVISMPELKEYFRLEKPVKDLAMEIATYLELGSHDLAKLRVLLDRLFVMQSGGRPVNNMLLKLLVDFVLVAQAQMNFKQSLQLVNELKERELALPTPAKRVMWDKSWVFAALGWLLPEVDEEMFNDYSEYLRRCFQEIDLWKGSVGTYAYLGYADYARIYYKKIADNNVQVLQDLLVWAIDKKDYQKALDVMEELTYLAGSPLWKMALFVLEPILEQLAWVDKEHSKTIDLAAVKAKAIEILAIVYVRHPHAVRSFLLSFDNPLPTAFTEQVEVRKGTERIAGGLLKGGLGTWGQFEVSQGFSDAGRPYLVNVFRTACQAKSLSQFLTVVAGTAINLLLDAPVFSTVVRTNN